jgi:hypothetical protein
VLAQYNIPTIRHYPFPTINYTQYNIPTIRCLSTNQEFNYKYIKKYIKKRRKSGIDAISTNVDDHDSAVTIASYLCIDTWRTPDLSVLTAHVCEKHASLAENPERTNQICQYSIGLHDASISNFGLSHAKVREYWLYRGSIAFLTNVYLCRLFLRNATKLSVPCPCPCPCPWSLSLSLPSLMPFGNSILLFTLLS